MRRRIGTWFLWTLEKTEEKPRSQRVSLTQTNRSTNNPRTALQTDAAELRIRDNACPADSISRKTYVPT